MMPCVDIDHHLNLRNTTRCRRDTRTLELVVLRACTLALVDLDEYAGLLVGIRREQLGLLFRNRCVPLDERRHHNTCSLDTERQSGDVEKQNLGRLLGGVARQDGGLDGRAVCNGLIGVDRLVRLLAIEEIGNELSDARDMRRTTNEDDLVHLRLVDLGVPEKGVKLNISKRESISMEVWAAEERVFTSARLLKIQSANSPLSSLRPNS